jgi:hypothetical protein
MCCRFVCVCVRYAFVYAHLRLRIRATSVAPHVCLWGCVLNRHHTIRCLSEHVQVPVTRCCSPPQKGTRAPSQLSTCLHAQQSLRRRRTTVSCASRMSPRWRTRAVEAAGVSVPPSRARCLPCVRALADAEGLRALIPGTSTLSSRLGRTRPHWPWPQGPDCSQWCAHARARRT